MVGSANAAAANKCTSCIFEVYSREDIEAADGILEAVMMQT